MPNEQIPNKIADIEVDRAKEKQDQQFHSSNHAEKSPEYR